MAVLVAVIGFVTTKALGEMRLIVCFDLAAITWVGLFIVLMNVAAGEDCAELSRSRWRHFHLFFLIVLTIVGIAAIPILSHPDSSSQSRRILHYGAALLAIALAWLVAHISFGLHYSNMYYSDATHKDEAQHDGGMAYPERKAPDYWDFMDYSFTIAMCNRTSDVTITGVKIRRVTLLHAIFSFFFVAAIFGLVVNILSDII
jgi:uncharacterized membrane protein